MNKALKFIQSLNFLKFPLPRIRAYLYFIIQVALTPLDIFQLILIANSLQCLIQGESNFLIKIFKYNIEISLANSISLIIILGIIIPLCRFFSARLLAALSAATGNHIYKVLSKNFWEFKKTFDNERVYQDEFLSLATTHLNAAINLYLVPILTSFSSLIIATVLIIYAFITSPIFTFIVLVIAISVLSISFQYIGKKLKRAASELNILRTSFLPNLKDYTSSYLDIIYGPFMNPYTSKLITADLDIRRISSKSLVYSTSSRLIFEALVYTLVAYLLYSSVFLKSSLIIGNIISTLGIIKAVPHLQNIASSFSVSRLNIHSAQGDIRITRYHL